MSSNDWLDLSGRVAAVTGGGAHGGNGHAIALGLARYGADVLVSDIDVPGAEQTAREIRDLGRRAAACRCDIGIPDEITAMFSLLDREFGRIDILVNNVGTGFRSHPEDLSLAQWQRVVRVNLDGTFWCSMEAGRRMIKQGHGGSIVNISSIAGSSALGRGNFVYSVTKGGINQFTRELAVEWSPHQIRVNAICPGPVRTVMSTKRTEYDAQRLGVTPEEREQSLTPMGRILEPDEVAPLAVYLASDEAKMVTGQAINVCGGMVMF